MSQNNAPSDFNDQRRSERDEVFLRTTFSVGKKSGISAQLVNLSAHGFMARMAETVPTNTPVKIMLPFAGEVTATVVWALGGRIGGSFDIPFEEKDYPKVLAAVKTAKPNWQFAKG